MKAYWEHVKKKWNVQSDLHGIWIMAVFAVTGTSLLFVKEPVFDVLGYDHIQSPVWRVLAYIGILYPLYQVLLLFWGTLLGQYRFFRWMLFKMNGWFLRIFLRK